MLRLKGAIGSYDGTGFLQTLASLKIRELLENRPRTIEKEGAESQYKVNDPVLYWSDTYRTWMQGLVEKVYPGGTYDLVLPDGSGKSMKRGAIAANMKWGGAPKRYLI